jgi:hypothetical protein
MQRKRKTKYQIKYRNRENNVGFDFNLPLFQLLKLEMEQ